MDDGNPLTKYSKLLEKAHSTSEAHNVFALDSEDVQSVATWNRLCRAKYLAQKALIIYVSDNRDVILSNLDEFVIKTVW